MMKLLLPFFYSGQQTVIRPFSRCGIFRKETKGNGAKSETTEVKDLGSTCSTSDGPINGSAKAPKIWFQAGEQKFESLVDMDGFIDKSLFIKELLAHPSHIKRMPYRAFNITAPRRFGKSTNLNMLKKFLEIQVDDKGTKIDGEKNSNYKLFNKLKIMDHKDLVKQHFGNHPIIYLDFKAPTISKPEDVLDHCRLVLRNAFKQHEYLLKNEKKPLNVGAEKLLKKWCDDDTYESLSKTTVYTSLWDLCKCLFEHFDRKKVFILVDEYDAIANSAMLRLPEVEVVDATRCLTTMLSRSIKGGSDYVQGAVLTGVSYFVGMGWSDGLNNVKACRFLHDHQFVEYYGLTEAEVSYISEKHAKANGKDHKKELEELKRHYNGYQSQKGIKIYSIWSVGNCLQENSYDGYWAKTNSFTFMENMLKVPVIQLCISELLAHKNVFTQVCDTVSIVELMRMRKLPEGGVMVPDIIFTVLLEEGYLSRADGEERGTHANVRIPNLEIEKVFLNLLRSCFIQIRGFSPIEMQTCASFFVKVPNFDTPNSEFEKELVTFHKALQQLSPGFKQNLEIGMNQASLHNVMSMTASYTNWDYDIEYKNRLPGNEYSRTDLVLLNREKTCCIILELKYSRSRRGDSKGQTSRTSMKALDQILNIEKQYTSVLTKYNVPKYLLMGISIDGDLKFTTSCLLNSQDIKNVIHSEEVVKKHAELKTESDTINQDSLHFY